MTSENDLQEKIFTTLLSGRFGDATGLTSSDFHVYVGTCEIAVYGRGAQEDSPPRLIAQAFVEALKPQLSYDQHSGNFFGSENEFQEALYGIEF